MDTDKLEREYREYGQKEREKFKSHLRIDKHSLDDAVISQPVLYYQISERCAAAESLRDQAKEALADIESRLGLKFRSSDAEKRVTEAAIAARVRTSPQYQEARDRYLYLKHVAEQWNVLREAYEQRSRALRDLVSLFTANYFSTDSLRNDSATRGIVNKANRELLAAERERRRHNYE